MVSSFSPPYSLHPRMPVRHHLHGTAPILRLSGIPRTLGLNDWYAIKICSKNSTKPGSRLAPIVVRHHHTQPVRKNAHPKRRETQRRCLQARPTQAPGRRDQRRSLQTHHKRTGGTESTNTSSTAATKPAGSLTGDVAKPILNAALLDGGMRQHSLAGERMSKALAIRQMHAVCFWQRLVRYSCSIICNPKDLYDGCLPDFFVLSRRGRKERRRREMTRAELEEAGFAYGEDLDVLEMQGMKLLGWVAEDKGETVEFV